MLKYISVIILFSQFVFASDKVELSVGSNSVTKYHSSLPNEFGKDYIKPPLYLHLKGKISKFDDKFTAFGGYTDFYTFYHKAGAPPLVDWQQGFFIDIANFSLTAAFGVLAYKRINPINRHDVTKLMPQYEVKGELDLGFLNFGVLYSEIYRYKDTFTTVENQSTYMSNQTTKIASGFINKSFFGLINLEAKLDFLYIGGAGFASKYFTFGVGSQKAVIQNYKAGLEYRGFGFNVKYSKVSGVEDNDAHYVLAPYTPKYYTQAEKTFGGEIIIKWTK